MAHTRLSPLLYSTLLYSPFYSDFLFHFIPPFLFTSLLLRSSQTSLLPIPLRPILFIPGAFSSLLSSIFHFFPSFALYSKINPFPLYTSLPLCLLFYLVSYYLTLFYSNHFSFYYFPFALVLFYFLLQHLPKLSSPISSIFSSSLISSSFVIPHSHYHPLHHLSLPSPTFLSSCQSRNIFHSLLLPTFVPLL